jgi:hypothetical protein
MITYQEYKNILKVSEFLNKKPPGIYGRIHRDLENIWEHTTITNVYGIGVTTAQIKSFLCHERYNYGHVLFDYEHYNQVLRFGNELRDFQLMYKLDFDFIHHVIKDRTSHIDLTVSNFCYFNFNEFDGMYQILIQREMEKGLFTTEPVTIYDSKWTPKEESTFRKLVNKIRSLF